MASESVVLYENLRSCSYTPFYLAQKAGLFEAEGLEVDLRLSPAPTETAQGLIEGRADVSFGGPMRVMMHHDAARARGGESPLVCFAQIVARDPFILVGRAANPQFRFADLIGPLVGVATDVPTPWMLLHDDLDRAGVDPAAVKRVMDAPMADNAAALERGEIDVVQVFEPYAEALVSSGRGHVWHRFSVRGDIAFTTFYTTRRFAAERRNACLALARAMAASLARLHAADPAETAALIGPAFFPDLAPASLARIVSGYREARLWPRGIALPAAAYARLKAALLAGGLIDRDIPYDDAVDAALCEPGASS